MAEYDSPESLVAAGRQGQSEGYRVMDAYTPYPIEELEEPLDIRDNRISLFRTPRRYLRRDLWIRFSLLGQHSFLTAQYRRSPTDQRPDVYPDHL